MKIVAHGVDNTPGKLYNFLKGFADRGINLVRVNGFSDPTLPGTAIFYVEAVDCPELLAWANVNFAGISEANIVEIPEAVVFPPPIDFFFNQKPTSDPIPAA